MNIKYTLPILGKTEVSLYGETEEIYSFLEVKSQIHRLKNLNQLGVIYDVIQTAHHPKYEYLFFLLFLIEKIKEIKGFYPLNRKVEGDVTGAELLKIWALLLAVGHLPFTFPVEKAALRFLYENQEKKNKLFEVIPDGDVRNYVMDLIQSQKAYTFYHAMAFLKIYKYIHANDHKDLSGRCAKYLSLYCQPIRSDVINSLAELFSKLRMFSYVLLDSYYTGAPNIIKLSDLEKTTDYLKNEHFFKLMKAMNDYLINEIYKKDECRVAEVNLYNAAFQKIQKTSGDYIVNLLYSDSDSDIHKVYLKYLRQTECGKRNYYPPISIETKRSVIFEQENEINKIISKHISKKNVSSIVFDVDRVFNQKSNKVSIFVEKGFEFSKKGFLPDLMREILAETIRNESIKYSSMLSFLKKREARLKRSGVISDGFDVQSNLMLLDAKREINQTNFVNILTGLLRVLFCEDVSAFRLLEKKGESNIPLAYYESAPLVLPRLDKEGFVKSEELKDLSCLMENLIKRKKFAKFIVFSGNLELHCIRDGKNQVLGEIDGFLVEFEKKRLSLYLLESKHKLKRGYSAARKQLMRIKKIIKPRFTKNRAARIAKVHRLKDTAYLKIELT